MQATTYPPSELPLDAAGAVYHLGLTPGELAPTVLLVGDPGRATQVSSHFDTLVHQMHRREFISFTGSYQGEAVSVLSTGIGTDNIDIAVNEMDALFNIDLRTRRNSGSHTSLRLVRIGTCGALQRGVATGSVVVSRYALGLDPLMHYYAYRESPPCAALRRAFMAHCRWPLQGLQPYAAAADPELTALLQPLGDPGITLTAPGFYGPQGRRLRTALAAPELNSSFETFQYERLPLANYEMETSALYGLGHTLGHRCCTLCLVIANRTDGSFLSDYHSAMDDLIGHVLQSLFQR